jgi:predicted nucleic acid-binding protein
VAAAFFQEPHAERAREVLASDRPLYAPDLISAEFGNVVWKRFTRREITEEEAAQLMADFLRLPLQVTPTGELADVALQLAVRTGRTVYDCVYLALAVRTNSVLVTADKRLVNALAGSPLAKHVAGIGQ